MDNIGVTGAKGYIGGILCKLMRIPENRQYDLPEHDVTKPEIVKKIADECEVGS